MSLISIATGTVQYHLKFRNLYPMLKTEQGEKAMEEFIQVRLISDKENFWDPLKKINIKIFQSLNKPRLLSQVRENRL